MLYHNNLSIQTRSLLSKFFFITCHTVHVTSVFKLGIRPSLQHGVHGFLFKGCQLLWTATTTWISQTLFAYWYREDLKTTQSKTFIFLNDLCRKSYRNTYEVLRKFENIFTTCLSKTKAFCALFPEMIFTVWNQKVLSIAYCLLFWESAAKLI